MSDIIGGRKTDRQVVRNRILPKFLSLQQGPGEIQGQLIARGADRQQGCKVLAVARTPGVWKGAPITREIRFPGIVVLCDALVAVRLIGELPGLAGIALQLSRLVPVLNPLGKALVIVIGSNKLPCRLGKPERLAAIAGQGDCPPVFYRDREYFALVG